MEIFNYMHPGLNQDPQATPALKIEAVSGTAIIQNHILQLTGPSSAQYNLKTYTLSSLANAVNAQSGFTATVLSVGSLSALVLLDGSYNLPTTIEMFTSFLWQLLKPVSIALASAFGAENQALLEMVMNTSDGNWLDALGELFGVYRQNNEPDELYAVRIFDFSVGHRVNNMAIQKSLQDLNYDASVDDSGTAAFDVNVVLPDSSPKGFFYTNDQISTLVDILKAAGTTANLILSGQITDTVSVSDVLSVALNNKNWTWDSIVWGEFNW